MIYFFFFFKQKTAYEIMPSLVGSEMCIRDSCGTAPRRTSRDREGGGERLGTFSAPFPETACRGGDCGSRPRVRERRRPSCDGEAARRRGAAARPSGSCRRGSAAATRSRSPPPP